jgi:hypothetical protein
MIDYLFPIFGLGVAVTSIVVKGLVLAKDMANAQMASEEQPHAGSDDGQFAAVPLPVLSRSTPIGNGRAENRSH